MWLRIHEHMYNLDNIRAMRFNYKNHSADPEESNVNSVFIEFNNGSSQKTVEDVALKSNKIQKQIMDKKIKKIIFVPERILNIVI